MPKTDLALAGGDYAPVADRIKLFYERFPDGRIITELVARSEREVTFRAAVYRSPADREPSATGWAAEREGDGDVNSVACLENTETSAIGRALANLGFTASAHRPSMEEMARASARRVAQGARAAHGTADSVIRPLLAAVSAGRASRPDRVAEPAPAAPQQSPQQPADMDSPLRADVRALAESAEREGLQPTRLAVVRELAERPAATPCQLEEVERGLRAWLARRTTGGPTTGKPPRV